MPPRKFLPIVIEPLQYADIDACARITAAAFATDRHTIVKQLGGRPFDMFEISRNGFRTALRRKNCVHVKAVDGIGRIVGHAAWGFRGVDEKDIPREEPPDEPSSSVENVEVKSEGKDTDGINNEEPKNVTQEDEKKGIERLHALEDADMQHMMAELMPNGTSCMYILGLIVAPQCQSQGVGSALIEFGNTLADHLGIFTWVHSSDQAWRAYAKFGFRVVKELDVDLDEYAPSPPGKEWTERLEGTGEGVTEDRWGHYVIRYMKRVAEVKAHGY